MLSPESPLCKQREEGRKTWVSYHASMLSVLLLFLFYPMLSAWCYRHGIHFFSCRYEQMTGKPCPFCGTTTQIWRLIHGTICISIPVLVLLVAYAGAVVKHCVMLFLLWCRKEKALPTKLLKWEVAVSFLLFAVVIATFYTAWFMGEDGFGAIRLTL